MPAIIAALVAAFFQAARQYLPGIVGRILAAFGIGIFSHTIAMPALMAFIQSRVSGLPAIFLAYFGALGFDVVATMFISAALAVKAQKVFLGKLSGA